MGSLVVAVAAMFECVSLIPRLKRILTIRV